MEEDESAMLPVVVAVVLAVFCIALQHVMTEGRRGRRWGGFNVINRGAPK